MVDIFLCGSLARHRRRRILTDLLNARAWKDSEPPSRGICLFFGIDYQKADENEQKQWFSWCRKPGRTFLLLPPFQSGKIGYPVDWHMDYRSDATEAEIEGLSALLQDEIQFEIRGKTFQFDIEAGHRFQDYSLNTVFYKPHSNSGQLALTVLPLWSLTLIDRKQVLRKWIHDLHDHTGRDAESSENALKHDEIEPTPAHYALMLHLWAVGPIPPKQIQESIALSKVIRLEEKQMEHLLNDIKLWGFWDNDRLSESGSDKLKTSPYWHYAEALREEIQ